MVERAYNVNPVCPSQSAFAFKFFKWGHLCPLDTDTFLVIFYVETVLFALVISLTIFTIVAVSSSTF